MVCTYSQTRVVEILLTCLLCDDDSSAEWTSGRTVDELHLCLIKAIDDDGVTRSYERQAEYLLYRIPVYKPVPYFNVYIEDLTPRLKKELAGLDRTTLNKVMKEAIGRIFEGLHEKYFLTRVRKLLKWRLLKRNDN